MITPVAIETISWKTYVVWACTNLSFIPITYFFYVETTGQTLEDIDLIVRSYSIVRIIVYSQLF